MPKNIEIDNTKMITIMTRLDFFEQFTKLEMQKLLINESHILLYEKGESVIKKGEYDNSFYILLSGSVYVVTDCKIITKVESGNFFGEMSFLTKEPRTANVISNENSLIMKIDEHLMQHLHVRVKEKIKDKIIEKLILTVKQMNQLLDASK